MSSDLATTRVDFLVANNVTWDDQLQFGYPDDQTWSFTGASFLLGIMPPPPASTPPPVLELSSTGGTITVVDQVLRILALNVPDATIQQYLPPGWYVYDLIMVSPSGARDALCGGKIHVIQGVTP
jgi:hypothetical protein